VLETVPVLPWPLMLKWMADHNREARLLPGVLVDLLLGMVVFSVVSRITALRPEWAPSLGISRGTPLCRILPGCVIEVHSIASFPG